MPALPYTYAIVQLDEGARVPTNAVECALKDVRADMPAIGVFDDVSVEWTPVKFTPAKRSWCLAPPPKDTSFVANT